MNDIKRLKKAAASRGHDVVFETRDVQDDSGYWNKKKRGWWMGRTYLGANAGDALIYIGEQS